MRLLELPFSPQRAVALTRLFQRHLATSTGKDSPRIPLDGCNNERDAFWALAWRDIEVNRTRRQQSGS